MVAMTPLGYVIVTKPPVSTSTPLSACSIRLDTARTDVADCSRSESSRSAQCTMWSTKQPPPESAGSVNQRRSDSGILPLFVPKTARTSPSRPARTCAFRSSNEGENRTGYATIRATPARSTASSIAAASAAVVARGFSQRIWAPGESFLDTIEIAHTQLARELKATRPDVRRPHSVRIARDDLDVTARLQIPNVTDGMTVGE